MHSTMFYTVIEILYISNHHVIVLADSVAIFVGMTISEVKFYGYVAAIDCRLVQM